MLLQKCFVRRNRLLQRKRYRLFLHISPRCGLSVCHPIYSASAFYQITLVFVLHVITPQASVTFMGKLMKLFGLVFISIRDDKSYRSINPLTYDLFTQASSIAVSQTVLHARLYRLTDFGT